MPTIYGIDPDGKPKAATVDADGKLIVSGAGGGGGGGGDASAANQVITNTRVGDLTETAPGTDTASSGLNGRLQRLAQRLTSLIALWSAGPGTAAAALRVTLASDGPGVQALASIDGIYAEIVDQPNATTTYICQAAIGVASSAASWRVRRLVVSGTTTTTTWAGSGAFNQIADNRASLTYA